jgi:hypothetical protein
MKDLLINNKREGRFMYLSSLFNVLSSVRSGALSLSDTYYNSNEGTWEKLDNISFLKKQNIPMNKEFLKSIPEPEDPTPLFFGRRLNRFEFANAFSANKHI